MTAAVYTWWHTYKSHATGCMERTGANICLKLTMKNCRCSGSQCPLSVLALCQAAGVSIRRDALIYKEVWKPPPSRVAVHRNHCCSFFVTQRVASPLARASSAPLLCFVEGPRGGQGCRWWGLVRSSAALSGRVWRVTAAANAHRLVGALGWPGLAVSDTHLRLPSNKATPLLL